MSFLELTLRRTADSKERPVVEETPRLDRKSS